MVDVLDKVEVKVKVGEVSMVVVVVEVGVVMV